MSEKAKQTGFYFKCSPEDMALIEQKMALTGIRNKSAFIRKMCIDGHVFVLQMDTLNEIKRLLSITANNVNQISRRVNSGGEAYRQDVAEVNDQLTEIRTGFGKLLALLSDVANAKPGKRFIPPPRLHGRAVREANDQAKVTDIKYSEPPTAATEEAV